MRNIFYAKHERLSQHHVARRGAAVPPVGAQHRGPQCRSFSASSTLSMMALEYAWVITSALAHVWQPYQGFQIIIPVRWPQYKGFIIPLT
ncbi:MAG: hypothetical protein IJ199_00315 [Prevotella sp.]|nr:hypothetical protein [Prevotella sp.]